jgi:hypothetical protein
MRLASLDPTPRRFVLGIQPGAETEQLFRAIQSA